MADQGDDVLAEDLGIDLYDESALGDAEEVRSLLDQGAQVNFIERKNGWTPLMVACQEGHIEVVTLLANRGADLEVRNACHRTALMLASSLGHLPGGARSRASARSASSDEGSDSDDCFRVSLAVRRMQESLSAKPVNQNRATATRRQGLRLGYLRPELQHSCCSRYLKAPDDRKDFQQCRE